MQFVRTCVKTDLILFILTSAHCTLQVEVGGLNGDFVFVKSEDL